MVDLSDICGLPIQLDENNGTLYHDETIKYENKTEVKLKELLPVLLNKFLKYPETVSKEYKNFSHSKFESKEGENLSYDLVVIPYGLLGIEYVKTHIYHSNFKKAKLSCLIEVIKGDVTIIIQKNKENDPYEFNTYVEDISIIHLSEGDRISIPTGVYYTFVNTGSQAVVVAILYSKIHAKIDYNHFHKEKGLAFYIISKNARLEIVANPRYKIDCLPINSTFRSLDEVNKSKFQHELFKKTEKPLFDLVNEFTEEVAQVLG